ncbi:MAG: DUF805 domain-containing protein [Novosphingobium sp.]
MLEWMLMPLKRYAEFSGRSRRKEFWSFFLLNLVVTGILLGPIYASMVSNIVAMQAGTAEPGAAPEVGGLAMGLGVLGGLWALGTLIPNIALTVRRLHDRDMSGWWYLGFIVLSIIPLIGIIAAIAYLVLMCLEGTKGPNRFGPDPKGENLGSDVFS